MSGSVRHCPRVPEIPAQHPFRWLGGDRGQASEWYRLDDGFSLGTIRTTRAGLRQIAEAAVELSLLPANPVLAVRNPKATVEERKPRRILSPVEVRSLLGVLDGQPVPAEGLAVASFRHLTSRALDPFPHHHNVVVNTAHMPDDTPSGPVVAAALRQRAGRLGVPVRQVRRLAHERLIRYIKWGRLSPIRPDRVRRMARSVPPLRTGPSIV